MTTADPGRLVDRALGSIDRMAEAMWRDEAARRGSARAVGWLEENQAERELWMRRATVAFLAMLEPKNA